MSEPLVLLRRDGAVAILTLNDPARRNAMTQAMGEALHARVQELRRDPGLRAVLLCGAGNAFSAGGDLGMIESRARQGAADPGGPARRHNEDGMRAFYGLFLSVRDLPCPTVAALSGAAIGAGLCVALACDVRIAARNARLGLNFARLGIHPGMGATWTLPRLVGPAHAADLLYTGRTIDGLEAERIGLVNRAVSAESVLPEALGVAGAIAASSPAAVRGARQALAQSFGASLEEQLAFEAARQAECFETSDLIEGITAIREKRDPKFRGS